MVKKLTHIGLVALFITGTAVVGAMPAQAAQTHAKPGIGGIEFTTDYYNNAQHSVLVGWRQVGECGNRSYETATSYSVVSTLTCGS